MQGASDAKIPQEAINKGLASTRWDLKEIRRSTYI